MTPLQAAVHQKLLETLPVRTHVVIEPSSRKSGGRLRTDEECQILRRKIRRMRRDGLEPRGIARALNVSRQTVYNYLHK